MASEAHLTIVELVKSLNTLHTDSVLQLVKEVVKKPHQLKGDQVLIKNNAQKLCYQAPFCKKPSFVSYVLEVIPGRHPHAAVHLYLYQEVSSTRFIWTFIFNHASLRFKSCAEYVFHDND